METKARATSEAAANGALARILSVHRSAAAGFARLEPVTIAILVLALAVLVVIPDKAATVFGQAKHALAENLPFMALAVFIAAAAKATGAETLIANAARGREGTMVLLFAVFGALSPFCSCGVIPIIASLLAAGIPLAPVMAFWMSSPLMDPNQFVITAGELGLQFAIARALAAIAMGIASGYVTMALLRTIGISNPLRFKVRITGENKYDPKVAHERKWRFWEDGARAQIFLVEGSVTFCFLLRWLTLAFLIEGLMMAFIPPQLIGAWLGASGNASIPFAGALGALIYVNAFAAIPLVSGLMKLGMSPGAGLTFLVAGSALSIPASMAVYVLVTRKVFFLHLGLSILGALAAGYLYAAYIALF
jgi:uncharacterized membrane protein YraQ (UPF0718 family)